LLNKGANIKSEERLKALSELYKKYFTKNSKSEDSFKK